jgi:hypothetical protein
MTTRCGRTTLISLLVCAAFGAPLTSVGAQGGGDDDDGAAGRGFFQVGYQRLDPDGLNSALQDAGLPALDQDYLTLGGVGYGSYGRFLIGGEGHALLGQDATTPDGARQLSQGGGFGLFRIGYLAFSRDNLDVYPLFGVGGGGMSLTIAERSAPTFDEVLSDPERAARLSTGMFLLDLGVGADYRLPLGDDDDDGGLLIGLHAGYTFAPWTTSWTLDDINSVAGGPPFQIEGLYVRLSLGGWGRGDDDD